MIYSEYDNPGIKRSERANGIHFAWEDKVDMLFAPYSFLSLARLSGDDELVLTYSFGTVTVQGRALYYIHELVGEFKLQKIIIQPMPEPNMQVWIKNICFEPIQDKEIVEPMFPGKR